jgi:hypothetical protein
MFGYNSVCPTALMILAETYDYPPEFDMPTKEVLMECTRIHQIAPKDSVSTSIIGEHLEEHWRRANEGTSSSIFGQNFGHCKAGLQMEYVTFLHALQSMLVV